MVWTPKQSHKDYIENKDDILHPYRPIHWHIIDLPYNLPYGKLDEKFHG